MISWLAFVFLGTLGWGISLFLIKILLNSLTPIDIVLYRMIIGVFTLIILIKYLDIHIPNYKNLIKEGFIVGLFNMTIPFYLTSYAEKHITSVLAAVMNGLTPLFTCLLSMTLFVTRQNFHLLHLVSIAFGMLGILIIHINSVINHEQIIYFIALLCVSISYAIAANYIKIYAATKNPLLIAASAAIFTIIFMLICKYTLHEIGQWNIPTNSSQVFALLWLGIISTGLSLYLYCFIIQKLGPIVASMITYLMIITGMLAGAFFMKEKISMAMFLGAFCIIISFLLIIHQNQISGNTKNFIRLISSVFKKK